MAIVLLLLVTACGGGSAPDAGEAVGTTSPAEETQTPRAADAAPGVSGDTITIGFIDPLSGPLAGYGQPGEAGVQWVFDQVNDRGGIHGRQIEVMSRDNECSPEASVSAAKELESEVFAVLGLTCSGASIAVRDSVSNEGGLPAMSFSAGGYTSSSPELGGLVDSFFYPSASVVTQAGSTVNFAMNELDAERVALVRQTDVYGKEGSQGVREMLDAYGVELVAEETVEGSASDVSPQVLRVRESNPDTVIMFLYEVPGVTFLRQAAELGLDANIVASGSITDPAVYEQLSEEALSNYYGSTVLRDVWASEPNQEITQAITEAYPDNEFNSIGLIGVAAAEIYIEALEQAGAELSREAFVEALNGMSAFETSTLAYPIEFGPQDHDAGKGMTIFQVVDGEEVPVDEGYWPGSEQANAPVTAGG